MSDRSEPKPPGTRGRPFKKGQSGNPKGRPKKNQSKSTLIAKDLLEGEAESIIEKVIEMALKGDRACLRICIDRLVPAKKDSPFQPGLPRVGAAADLPQFFAEIAARFEGGEITASEARALKDLAETYRRLIEMAELEPRVKELEDMFNSPGE